MQNAKISKGRVIANPTSTSFYIQKISTHFIQPTSNFNTPQNIDLSYNASLISEIIVFRCLMCSRMDWCVSPNSLSNMDGRSA